MPQEPIDFTIFYSWQSDLPDETNRQAIRVALRVASNKVEEAHPHVRVLLDEATRGASGSPNIPATILDKIKSCDVFVCDVTTINTTAEACHRRIPNPNVIFELGFAVAHLGWARIVMLFNQEFGDLNDLPFDIDRHRTSPYRLSAADPKNRSNQGQLAASLRTGLLSVLDNRPVRPFDAVDLTPEYVRRKRDILNLKWILASVHFPTLDQMISDLPEILYSRALHFWEGFNGVVQNSLFHLYDDDAIAAITSLHQAWKTCVSNGEQYHMAANPNVHVFRNPGDGPLTAEQEAVWKDINLARAALQKSRNTLLDIVRDRYLEIDIEEMNNSAWREYLDFQRETEERFGRAETSMVVS